MVDISVDFDFYTKEYKGSTVPSTLFDKYIQLAHLDLTNEIGLNLYTVEADEVELITQLKYCQCALAEFEFKYGLDAQVDGGADIVAGSGEVKSESAGSVSRSYSTTAEVYGKQSSNIISNTEKYKRNVMLRYLRTTGLLYKGLK